MNSASARRASPADSVAIARIYNEGIEERIATFETRPRPPDDIQSWFEDGHPVVVVEEEGRVLAFASTSEYSPRECYRGVAEFSVYVARDMRGQGLGKLAMSRLIEEARLAGYWKLVSCVFVENKPSLALLRTLGFRHVGVYRKHAQLDGIWRDVVIVELLL